MTSDERALLLLLAEVVANELQNDLAANGLAPDAGRGGAQLRKMAGLVAAVVAQPSSS